MSDYNYLIFELIVQVWMYHRLKVLDVFMIYIIIIHVPPGLKAELRQGNVLPIPSWTRSRWVQGGYEQGITLPKLGLWPRGGQCSRIFENFCPPHLSPKKPSFN